MGSRRDIGSDAPVSNKKGNGHDIFLQPISIGWLDPQISVLGRDVLFKDAKYGQTFEVFQEAIERGWVWTNQRQGNKTKGVSEQ